jgi:hypothetical protein
MVYSTAGFGMSHLSLPCGDRAFAAGNGLGDSYYALGTYAAFEEGSGGEAP